MSRFQKYARTRVLIKAYWVFSAVTARPMNEVRRSWRGSGQPENASRSCGDIELLGEPASINVSQNYGWQRQWRYLELAIGKDADRSASNAADAFQL